MPAEHMLLCIHMRKIAEGSWDEITSWEFFLDSIVPPTMLCTAVMCIAFTPDLSQVVLTRNQRGWDFVGGHIEENESLENTLLRESLEEGGFTPVDHKLFGYHKLTSTEPVPHNQRDGFYPHPHAYMPFFVATVNTPLAAPTGEEIFESRLFTVDELPDYLNDYKLALIHAARDHLA